MIPADFSLEWLAYDLLELNWRLEVLALEQESQLLCLSGWTNRKLKIAAALGARRLPPIMDDLIPSLQKEAANTRWKACSQNRLRFFGTVRTWRIEFSLSESPKQRATPAANRRGHRRPFPSLAARGVRRGGPQQPLGDEPLAGLLALAVVLNLVELAMRKWRGLLEMLRPRTRAAVAS